MTRVDPEPAKHVFKVVGSVAEDLEVALARVTNVRSTLPQPWGTDEYGQRFSQQREQNASDTLESLRGSVESLKILGENGENAVDNFVEMDAQNAANLAPDS
ncbi:hypothetical protein [Actinoplanes sp. NBRC 103695]|uniref:hypothetical protein n=1 Tax=Actinoplanes sp. NBRC 103695 TaxID=3032202 RepID=UPI0025537E42|nr:hypothetical protein [Actinoplanes sp. NBRC 103695]